MKKLIYLFILLVLALQVNGQQTLSQFDGFNANDIVDDIVHDEVNDIIYLGGAFTKVNGLSWGAAISKSTGDIPAGYAAPNGIVEVAIPDGSGGYYVGGWFTEIGGVSRNYLAQLDASGNVTNWDPGIVSGRVEDLEISGNTLYVAGSFSNIGGMARNDIASFDIPSGNLTSWTVNHNMTIVYDLEIYNGLVYAAGQFGNNVIAADPTTGVIQWEVSAPNLVYEIEIDNDILYVGGSFGTIDGVSRSRLAAVDLSDNSVTAWNPAPDRDVLAIQPNGSTVFIGGEFLNIGGSSQRRIAEVDASTGLETGFSPFGTVVNFNIHELVIDGGSLYVGGNDFYEIDIASEAILSSNPITGVSASNQVRAVGFDATSIYIGGTFQTIGGDDRNGIAAIDGATGALTSFDPSPDGVVRDLILDGTVLYVAGDFQNIGGEARNGIASLSTATGNATTWNPNAIRLSTSGKVYEMVKEGSLVYAVGDFTEIGGQPRVHVAAIDDKTGLANSLNPNSDVARVQAIAIDGGVIYVGGTFQSFGGATRRRIAAFDKNTGALSSWDPNASGGSTPYVNSLAVGSDGTVYVGGNFSNIGGQSRLKLAALDPLTGLATSWNPAPNSQIFSVRTTQGGTLYTGGNFSTISGMSRNRLAAFDTSDGSLSDWDPSPAGSVYAIEPSGLNVFVGGTFSGVLGTSNIGFAGLTRNPEAPTNLSLDNLNINENETVGTVVGNFSVFDEPDTHTYELVSGTGSDDNSDFQISGVRLQAMFVPDFETKASYSVRVRVTDGQGNTLEEPFSIAVNNVIETGNDILDFSISGQIGSSTIDVVNHTVQVDMGFGTDISNLAPTITTSSGAIISPLSGASQDFTGTVNYTVTAENGSMQSWDVTIVSKLQAGTYTIGGGADYSSVLTAFADLRDHGISGDVVFEIEDGYTDNWSSSFVFDDFDGTSSHSVTVTVADGASSATIDAPGAILIARGVKNIIIDGKGILEFQSSGTSNSAILTFLFNGISGEAVENIEIKNTKFSSQRNAISFSSAINVTVSGCEFGFLDNSPTYKGFFSSMRLLTVNGAHIFNNKINYSGAFDHVTSTTVGDGRIHGIDVQTGGDDISIYNNSIYLNPVNARRIEGIYVLASVSGSLNIDHNTILIEGTNSVDGFSGGIEANVNGVTAIERVQNNIVTITRNNLNGDERGINYDKPTDFTISHNNIFITDDAGTEDYANSFELGDLPALLLEAPGTTVTQATFTNAANGDLTLSGTSLSDPDFRGIPVATVTTDQNGISRNVLVPSRGAYETPNNITDILSMTFTEISGSTTVDDVNHTVNAAATLGTDLTALAPSFSLFTGASISPNSGTTRDFTSTVSYTVTAEDASTQMWDVTIVEANGPPTDIQLTSTDVDENSAPGTVVGFFSSTDPNSSDSHTYTLVSGTGDTDNAAFNVFGNNIRTAFVFDFETKPSYSVLVQSDDQNGGTFEKQFTITVNDINDAPTDVNLSISNVNENEPAGTVVGTLTSVDQDAGDAHTYSLKIGTPDNAFFDISNDQLLTDAVFDFETKSTYNLEIITDDGNGGTFEQEIAVTINDETSLITDISLSGNTLDENQLQGIFIGTFTVQGADLSGSYNYDFVAGPGDVGNGSFNISDDNLLSFAAFNHEGFPTIDIRVEATGIGGSFDKRFTININDLVEAPTDIDLSNNMINESLAVGTVVGTLSTVDQDEGENYTYDLVSGTGDSGNGSFQIVNDELRSNAIFDFETQNSYSVLIQTDDENGNQFTEIFTINIGDVPPMITDIGLSNSDVSENVPAGTLVGNLSTIGEEVSGTFTYTFVVGQNANALFDITNGNQLVTNGSLDHETDATLGVQIMTDDGNGGTFDKIIFIDINNVNEDPTNISVSSAFIDENEPVGTAVGTITSTDADAVFSHAYSLVSGTGDIDNAAFSISDDQLNSAIVFNAENQSVFKIRVRADDGLGGTREEEWTINVNDVAEAPTDLMLSSSTMDENNGAGFFITMTSADEDAGETFTYALVSGVGDTDNGSFSIDGDKLQLEVSLDFETKDSYSVLLQTDDGNGGQFEKQFTLSVNDLNEAPTNIQLSNRFIDESTPAGTLIGILSTEDVDSGDTHTYTVADGCSVCRTNESSNFEIVGNELRSKVVFDFESDPSYGIDITTTDAGGNSITEGFIISINDLPASVTAVTLDVSTIDENESPSSLIGTFSTSGEDLSGSFTYTLVSGTGDDDNASFTTTGGQLFAAESFNFEVKNSYSILVMTDDGNGLTLNQQLTISIGDVSESTDTNILTFELAAQTGPAVIDQINNTVAIEVVRGTDLTSLTPTITVSTGASITPDGAQDFSSMVTYTVTAEEPTSIVEWQVTVTEAQNNETDILTFVLAEQTSEATIDATNHTVTIEVANGSDVTSLTPTVTISAGATVSLGGAQDFTNPVTYTVTAEDGTTEQDWLVTITIEPAEVTAIDDNGYEVSIYPNPTSDWLTIETPYLSSSSIQLFDMKGGLLKVQRLEGRARISLQDLDIGLYLLKLTSKDITTTTKILIRR